MSLEDNFHKAVDEWKEFCQNPYSILSRFLDCDAYRRIVDMGPEVLPLIRQEYAKLQRPGDPGPCWCYAIREIVPEFNLPVGEKNSGSPTERVAPNMVGLKVDEVQKATIRWLDENMHKYVPTQ